MSEAGVSPEALENVRQMGASIGLTRLTLEHLQQLQRATEAAKSRQGVLRFAALTPADEPSHVYFLAQE